MKLFEDHLSLSPTDLSYFLGCRHRTALELSVAHGIRRRPAWNDPLLEVLFELGRDHERRYVASLATSGARLVDLSDRHRRDEAIARTLEAMHLGVDVIVQAALGSGRWYGRPDILLKIDRRSPAFGGWSYEVADTKLARETRGGTILQLGLYCEMLEAAQGLAPAEFHVVIPAHPAEARRAKADGAPQPESPDARLPGFEEASFTRKSYRFRDYAAYFRLLKRRLEAAVEQGHDALASAHYPEPVDHCDICPWSPACSGRRRADDHLSLVAGITRLQRRELAPFGVITVEQLGALPDPFPLRPRRGSIETYERVRDQARVQIASRTTGRIAYELIESAPIPPRDRATPPPVGLARLPQPSPGDVFLDLEGDPLAGGSESGEATGREYLFGLAAIEPDGRVSYRRWWADDPAAERRAFEAVVDLIVKRWDADPGMHVYHYAPYEPSALKRLHGRYATREREVDRLLRGGRFVDLYAVVRQGVRAGVDRYSIKNLEPLYAFGREVDLRDASRALRTMEQALELEQMAIATPEIRVTIEGYNRDDCVSALRLRDWLELRRDDLIARGRTIDRPPLDPGDPSPELDEKATAVEALRARLLAIDAADEDPAPGTPHSAPGTPNYLLAYLLDFHRREDKAGWWEYFRLRELPEGDLFDEPRAVAGLVFAGEIDQIKRSVVHRYRYPVQEFEIRRGDTLKTQDGKAFGDVLAVNREARTIDMKVGPSKRHQRPTALFAHKHVASDPQEKALFALGERVADAGGVERLPQSPVRALLMRATPRLTAGAFAPPRHDDPRISTTAYAVSIVTQLDRTALPIQGPPGTGKTYTGAQMICELLAAGRKVGVTGPSHKVIRNLLEAVAKAAADRRVRARLGHRCGEDDDDDDVSGDGIAEFGNNEAPLTALNDGTVNVLGGTAWLWARPEYAGSVDVLFVDEAGQMSLANTVATAAAGASLVLLGDPQQLDQPTQGSHPDGVGLSALDHILGGEAVMPRDRGLFLPVTWRLAPSICAFTSELFYAGELQSKPGLEHQIVTGTGRFDGSGLYLIEVPHDGNRNASDEEARMVAGIVASLLAEDAAWIDEYGVRRSLTPEDVRVVAPFNAHVARIRDALTTYVGRTFRSAEAFPSADAFTSALSSVPVGTVDKFQGQEAPVVIYSMATSHPDDAPRGMRFLYSLHRLNVATSRARCAAILVASPDLFQPECRTPRQMHLANALCRFRELARV
jgi:uncharacterized protein